MTNKKKPAAKKSTVKAVVKPLTTVQLALQVKDRRQTELNNTQQQICMMRGQAVRLLREFDHVIIKGENLIHISATETRIVVKEALGVFRKKLMIIDAVRDGWEITYWLPKQRKHWIKRFAYDGLREQIIEIMSHWIE